MSRIGKNPIVVPAGVTVEVAEGIITVKGKKGQLTQEFSDVTVTVEGVPVVTFVTVTKPSASITAVPPV